MIQDVEYIELQPTPPEETEQKEVAEEGVFKTAYLHSDYFPCSAWFISNFGIMTNAVWWGYRVGYYLVLFPTALATLFGIDLSLILMVRVIGYALKKVCDLIFDGLQPFAKIIMGAAAIVIITLFISNQGWDGLQNLYKTLCEHLKNFGN